MSGDSWAVVLGCATCYEGLSLVLWNAMRLWQLPLSRLPAATDCAVRLLIMLRAAAPTHRLDT